MELIMNKRKYSLEVRTGIKEKFEVIFIGSDIPPVLINSYPNDGGTEYHVWAISQNCYEFLIRTWSETDDVYKFGWEVHEVADSYEPM